MPSSAALHNTPPDQPPVCLPPFKITTVTDDAWGFGPPPVYTFPTREPPLPLLPILDKSTLSRPAAGGRKHVLLMYDTAAAGRGHTRGGQSWGGDGEGERRTFERRNRI